MIFDLKRYVGKGVFAAAAYGKIKILESSKIPVAETKAENTEKEKKRFENAKSEAISQLQEIYEKALEETGEENAQIFSIHMMLLEDEDFNDAVIDNIQSMKVSADYAVYKAGEDFSHLFSSMDDPYMKARCADIIDISQRLVKILSGVSVEDDCPVTTDEKVIICAEDLTPSETVNLDKNKVAAFVTVYGSSNSHTAILARNMNIPAVIGIGNDFFKEIKDGDFAVCDGSTGEVFVNPDEKTVGLMEDKQRKDAERLRLLQELKGKESITLDGRKIKLFANIGSVSGVSAVIENDADGIGLFRSEFLYLEGKDYPGEEEQFSAYKKVLEDMKGKKVIIRTLDIGADKQVDYFNLKKEENPALGNRAVRLCLSRPELFRTQLRALYRASVYGNLGIMFPMITSVWEVEKILNFCSLVKKELENEGSRFDENIEIGIMIETPAAAIISDRLAKYVDFFSVGTNDLTQYTLACDRQNSDIEDFCNPHHEAVMRLIKTACDNAHKNGIWIGICGELAGDTTVTEEFLKMGIDELSVSPSYVLKLRDKIRRIRLG